MKITDSYPKKQKVTSFTPKVVLGNIEFYWGDKRIYPNEIEVSLNGVPQTSCPYYTDNSGNSNIHWWGDPVKEDFKKTYPGVWNL